MARASLSGAVGPGPVWGPWLPSLHAVAVAIRADALAVAPDWLLVVEGLYVSALSRAPSVLALAESAGELAGPLRSGPVLRPVAAHWRAKVLRLPRSTPAAAAEAYAVKCVLAGAIAPGLPPELAAIGHVAEAACLATYGMLAPQVKDPPCPAA